MTFSPRHYRNRLKKMTVLLSESEQKQSTEHSDPLDRKRPQTMGFISLSEFDEPSEREKHD